MAASAAVYRHVYVPESKSSRKNGGRFSLIVRLLEDGVVRLKNIKDGATVQQIKRKLELHCGFTQSTFTLYDIDGNPIDDNITLRLGENISDNDVMKLFLSYPYADVYETLTSQKDQNTLAPELPEELIDKEIAFNILFMSASLGCADYCREIITNQDVALTDTTPSGNTCLHAAAAKDQVVTGMMLCSHGAELYQKNKRGETALDVALEFGSFTCERKLRLSQWTRRKTKLKETEYNETFTPPSQEAESNKLANQNRNNNHSRQEGRLQTAPAESEHTETVHRHTSGDNLRRTSRPSTAMQLLQRPPTRETPRRRMSEVNHQMPKAAVDKKEERIKRSKSAPPLNAEVRNQRLCRVLANDNPEGRAEEVKREKERFTLSRPQFLQYIKSSTGVVEEDYFADIFPEQEEKPKDVRSFDDQMKRNERIFKKMFKESGVDKHCSDTDSEEEMARQFANKRAVRRWDKKKQAQKREEQKKRALLPSQETENTKRDSLARLLMIGDTSGGKAPVAEPATYIRAYQACRAEFRAKSAVSTKSNSAAIDPVTYEEWVAHKPSKQTTHNEKTTPNRHTPNLTRRIDYTTWLESANRRTKIKIQKEKREEQQKKDFEEWIEELKEEVGTFEYWRKRKEEQMAKERQLRLKKEREEKKKSKETARRRELAKDIYRHWAVDKEISKLKSEQAKLEREKERLSQVKQTKR